MSLVVPERLRHSVTGMPGGADWLDALPDLVHRAMTRWDLTVGPPFTAGMVAWTAGAVDATGREVVLKVSFPHDEARHEAAALRLWRGDGGVELLAAHDGDWALLLARARPGSSLADAHLTDADHIAVGAGLIRRFAAAGDPVDADAADGFPLMAGVAVDLAELADERVDRLGPAASSRLGRDVWDRGFLADAVDLLRTLPTDAPRTGLVHGDLNPGNILRDDAATASADPLVDPMRWRAIDPKPLVGDLAWDPWPLLTQIGSWTLVAPEPAELVGRTARLADLTGLDAWRVAAWSTARSVESALWSADRGWWTGYRGADGDLARARVWCRAATRLGRR